MVLVRSPEIETMSSIDVRPIASIRKEPWRNGGGITRPLATESNQWRISLAEIERDGPYSRFEGMSRTSLIVRGRGVMLRDKHATVLLKPFEAVEFDGDAGWNASLIDGPVTALNVMSARGRHRVKVRAIVEPINVPLNCAAVVVALDSGCTFSESATHCPGTVPRGHVLVVNDVTRPLQVAPAKLDMPTGETPGLAVLVTIEPVGIRMND